MIYFKSNKWNLPEFEITYIEESEGEVTKYIGLEGVEWWKDFANLWSNTFEIKEINPTEFSEEQHERLNIVNELKIPKGTTMVENYVINGKFEDNCIINGKETTKEVEMGHPLYIIKLSEENRDLEKSLMELSIMIGGMQNVQ